VVILELSPKIVERRWKPSFETEIFERWEKDGLYDFETDDDREPFVIDTPPPYPSGSPWHIGAAAHYSQIDMIARTARMRGYNVLFPIGVDRNGLPVELYTEKKYKIRMATTSREKFIELCKTALDDLEIEMIGIMKRMGMSGNFREHYRTDSKDYRTLTQSTFINLWHQGLIYQSKRPNNYCSVCRTTIADAEVGYEELPSRLAYIRLGIKDTESEEIVIATTRPELMGSCKAILVNSQDDRYTRYHNLFATTPIFNKEIKIIPHPSAKIDFGSGAVMICSYGDYTDVQLFRELGLEEVIAIDINGRMTANAGPYEGMKVKQAREKIILDLEGQGLVTKVEDLPHRTPICERSRTPIEIVPMDEYYLKQLDFRDQLYKDAESLTFHPEEHRRRLLDWISSISIDWPISRRRYYATEVPVWYCKSCKSPNIPEPGRYYRPWKESPPFSNCHQCGKNDFVGDERTFDTWMDSSISPLYITGYMTNKSLFAKTYPVTLRPQSKDIVRTWLHYTILRCRQLTGTIPFSHAWIMGYGVDERGERMSKSKGNVIDPFPILEKYGADMFRLWAASESSLGSDFRVSESKISGVGKFLTKLWNIARFISSFPAGPDADQIQNTDKWILDELSDVVKESLNGYHDFNFFRPSNRVREFVWNTFASQYVEMVKQRAYGVGFSDDEIRSARSTLHLCLKTCLLLLAPITPFITERIWTEIYSEESIHLQRLPEPVWNYGLGKYSSQISKFNSETWNMKRSKGLSLRDPISVSVPKELIIFGRDLTAMHNLQG
jgi:valyl-tRNA synthetase